MNINKIFQQRESEFRITGESFARKSSLIGILRLALFLVAAVAVVYFANARMIEIVGFITVGFVLVFFPLVKYNNSLNRKRDKAMLQAGFNKDEQLRLELDFDSFDQGSEFSGIDHPYSADLDIFGSNSVFQLLNRTSTGAGRALMAEWLKNLSTVAEMEKRQEAVRELIDEIDWRQEFQANGVHKREEEEQVEILKAWVKSPIQLQQKLHFQLARWISPALALAAIVAFFSFGVSFYWAVLALIVNGFWLRAVLKLAGETTEQTYESMGALKAYRELIAMMETRGFQSGKLQALKEEFVQGQSRASREIRRLQIILDNLQVRANVLHALFNLLFLLDIHWLIAAESWRKRNQEHVIAWFRAINEMEVVTSLAGFAYANPVFVFPTLHKENYMYQAAGLGHPLIPEDSRVSNNFAIAGQGNVHLITGSNMSGKSTFLRTTGVNAILAFIGAPVCAREMEIGRMRVFTSMRNQDNLEENISSFYAELRRIRMLLNIASHEGPGVFYCLDEILKGTNSKDRHNGAAALIRQLSKEKAFGLVSTHDLELGDLAGESKGISNYSFNSSMLDGKINFDYKLKEGLCHSFNASELMKQMGIEL